MSLTSYDNTTPQVHALGHDDNGFFVDYKWYRSEVSEFKPHRNAAPQQKFTKVKAEERVYCTQPELVAVAKELKANEYNFCGQIPSLANATSAWGVTVSKDGEANSLNLMACKNLYPKVY